jgi:CubicO group peptidase (beta-lactamase class C family)
MEMNKAIKKFLQYILWGALALVGLIVILYAIIAIRYSPEYVYRELFMNLGGPYDFRILPSRTLTASPAPFHFQEDASKAGLVRETFQSDSRIQDLETFLQGTGTQAFLVIQNDAIIYERYFLEHQRDSLVTSFSVAKSFDSALIGIAIQEGFIKSADDPITDYIPELAQRDPRFMDIHILNLLMMGSGLRYDSSRPLSFGDDNLTFGYNDLRHLALTETQVIEPPGKTFLYNNYNPLLLGLILERATGRPVTDYLQDKIWTPLGMEYAGSWSLDAEKNGFEKMETGINAAAIDFAKFGRLYLNGGRWNGTQLVPAEWVKASIHDNGLIQVAPIYYGYMWWGEKCNPASQDFLAMGDLGQFIYVAPAKHLILVRFGEKFGVEGQREEWMIWGDIFCQFAKALP